MARIDKHALMVLHSCINVNVCHGFIQGGGEEGIEIGALARPVQEHGFRAYAPRGQYSRGFIINFM